MDISWKNFFFFSNVAKIYIKTFSFEIIILTSEECASLYDIDLYTLSIPVCMYILVFDITQSVFYKELYIFSELDQH